ncbi:MAG: hypothetical protein ACYDCD_12970 [Candidatus Acidiferrales bacterium]
MGGKENPARHRARAAAWYHAHKHENKLQARLRWKQWWERHAAEVNEHKREKTFRWRDHHTIEERELLALLGENWGGTIVSSSQLKHPCYKIFSPRKAVEWEEL